MLRITRTPEAFGRATLVLQGRIASEWAGILERECADAVRSGLRIALDLAGVTFISSSGVEALSRLSRSGVAIFACPPLIADLLGQEGIHVDRGPEGEVDA
ncbi:MAG TPA: hypothetical protein VF139_06050 [Candidatus Polarisedimenticolaceae bacterium]